VKVLAILQNQWFNDPVGAERVYARHAGDWDRRAKLNAAYLFFGCLTGKRILAAFGEDMRFKIIWEEASPKKAGKSSGAFPADPQHIRTIIEHHKPDVVLTFGRIAANGLLSALRILDSAKTTRFAVIGGPHPAARHATVCAELAAMAAELRRYEEFRADLTPIGEANA
jgi:hypothetical protein